MGFFIHTIPPAVLASLLAAFVATLGLLVVLVRDEWARRNQVYFTAFAAGVLLTTSLMLFPDALTAVTGAPFAALAGYLLLYGINSLVRTAHGAVLVPLFAIGLHSFLDGFEYGVLFNYDLMLGWIASTGLIAHEFAEGVILYAVLRTAGANMSASLLGAFVGAALTTPAGAIVSQGVLLNASPVLVAYLLAAASGALLYVGATHLPSQLRDAPLGRRVTAILTYSAGVALALVLSVIHIETVHGHDHDHDHSHDHDHRATLQSDLHEDPPGDLPEH